MALDESAIRRIMREEREEAERNAADKAERDELRARLDKLEAKGAPKKDEEKKDDAADHDFEV